MGFRKLREEKIKDMHDGQSGSVSSETESALVWEWECVGVGVGVSVSESESETAKTLNFEKPYWKPSV